MKGFRTSPAFTSFFAAIQPRVKDISDTRHYAITSARWMQLLLACADEIGAPSTQ